jgi:hypothetical protein
VDLGRGIDWREWRLLAFCMAEYRSDHDAAAIEAVLAAVRAEPNNAVVASLSGFHRAMSLLRQGKRDEARKLAIETAAQMKIRTRTTGCRPRLVFARWPSDRLRTRRRIRSDFGPRLGPRTQDVSRPSSTTKEHQRDGELTHDSFNC